MNRRGTFLSNEMTSMHCREYMAYPLGYAAANDIGNFQNSRLKGIKPSRHQRLPPRPQSIDIAAVSKARGTSNPFLAASIYAMAEQEKIIEEKKRPITINEPLTARQLYVRYGQDNNLLAEIGRTKKEVMTAFRPDKFDLQKSQDIRDQIDEYYNKLSRGTGIVRPVVASAETRASQLLEQIKGIRTDVQNLKLSQEQRANLADRAAISEKLLTFRQNIESASKEDLINKYQQFSTLYGIGRETQSSLQAMNKQSLKNKLAEFEKQRLEGTIQEIQTLSYTPVRLDMFKTNYQKLSDTEKRNVLDQMANEVQSHLGVGTKEDLEFNIGDISLDNLVDYIKNNSLALPNLTPPIQLTGIAPMQQSLTAEAGSSTDQAPSTEAPTESTM